ncbi:hypothetical protein DDT91_11835 [Algoriphagus sp. AK58]|nr:hypothetical protein [Algoriphagus sp. AK58]
MSKTNMNLLKREKGFSVIICTYNGRKRLGVTLNHIINLSIPVGYDFELIIVDNRSSDLSLQFCKDFLEGLHSTIKIKYLSENNPGKAYALEKAFDNASFSHAIICDDDNWLEPNYLTIASQVLEKFPDIGIVGGKSVPQIECEIPDWFPLVESAFVIGGQAKAPGYMDGINEYVWGAGMIFKMEIWDKLRSQDFSLVTGKNVGKAVGEDSELSLLARILGYRLYYQDTLVFKHFMPKERIDWKVAIKYYRGFGSTKPYYIFYKNFSKAGKKLSIIEVEREIARLVIYITKELVIKIFTFDRNDRFQLLNLNLVWYYFLEVINVFRIRKGAYKINHFLSSLHTS